MYFAYSTQESETKSSKREPGYNRPKEYDAEHFPTVGCGQRNSPKHTHIYNNAFNGIYDSKRNDAILDMSKTYTLINSNEIVDHITSK